MMDRRTALKNAAGLGAALLFSWPAELLAQTSDEAVLASVNPELREFAKQMLPYFRSQPQWSRATLAQMRNGMAWYGRKPIADVPYQKRQIPGSKGQPPVDIYVINARKEGRHPAILHTHGGGYIAGSALSAVPDMQDLSRLLDCVVVTVDYRLAPETTYRGSIEDNYAGLKWLHDNAAALGVDPARIAVMGESAGGGHAALLAITARDRREVPVAFQCLIYPMLDDRTGTTRQVPPHVGKLIWTAASNRFGWESFLGTSAGGRTAPVGAVPARVQNLAGLAPAFIGVGSIDLFLDEDVDYAQRLNAAGVPTELIVVPGAFHGFDSLPAPSKVAKWFNAAKLDALRRGLGIALA
jgi:acetyl esterase/lipase